MDDAVFNLDFLYRAAWENCIHVTFNNNLLAVACALANTDSVLIFVNMAVCETESLKLLNHPVCSVELVACRSFNHNKLTLLLDLKIFFVLDELKTVLYFFHFSNGIDNALYLIRCYIRHKIFLPDFIYFQ